MGVFDRIRDLLRMNVNAVLDGAEDPVKAISLIVEDMREETAAARTQIAEAITRVGPWGVDSLTHTNRRLDSGGFSKDLALVEAFVTAARGTDRP